MVSSKTLNAHLKTIRGIVVKGFTRVEQRIEGVEKRLGERITTLNDRVVGMDTKIDLLATDIDDLAGMTAREFKAVRGEIAHRNLLQDA